MLGKSVAQDLGNRMIKQIKYLDSHEIVGCEWDRGTESCSPFFSRNGVSKVFQAPKLGNTRVHPAEPCGLEQQKNELLSLFLILM